MDFIQAQVEAAMHGEKTVVPIELTEEELDMVSGGGAFGDWWSKNWKKAVAGAVGAVIGSAAGAYALGSTGGPWGAVIGAVIGAAVGAGTGYEMASAVSEG